DLPMAGDPGGDMAVYCSMDTNLALGAGREGTGQWIPDFFNTYFAKPLQITSYFMNLMPTGETYGGGGFEVRPRGELKLGPMVLVGGCLEWPARGQRAVGAGVPVSSSTLPATDGHRRQSRVRVRLAYPAAAGRGPGGSGLLCRRQWRTIGDRRSRPRPDGGHQRRRLRRR